MRLHEMRCQVNKCLCPPSETEPGGQVGPVAICDVGVFFEEEGDLIVGVEPNPLGQEHRPVVVAAQFHVMGSLQQLLRHLQQHRVLLLLRWKASWLEILRLAEEKRLNRFWEKTTIVVYFKLTVLMLLRYSHIPVHKIWLSSWITSARYWHFIKANIFSLLT